MQNVVDVEKNIADYEKDHGAQVFPEEEAQEKEILTKFLQGLAPTAREVLSSLLQGGTLEEAGEEQGFTRERARQIKDGTLDYYKETRMYKENLK